MNPPLVTPIDSRPDGGRPDPTVLIIFNDRQGPGQVVELMTVRHAFIESEVWETVDESDRPAYLLAAWCETATAEALLELIGSRLPDYIQPRRYPLSRLAHVRATGTRLG